MPTSNPSPSSPEQPHETHIHLGSDNYEFTDRENKVIGRLSEKMAWVGLFILVLGGVVVALGAVRREYDLLVSGLIYALLGVWTERAGHQFRKVVTTKGQDIHHLMHALEDLRKLYTLQFWGALIAIIGSVVLIGAHYAY